MNTTTLNLLFLNDPDSKNIFVQDTSVYNNDLEVDNPIIEITPPNYSTIYKVIYPTLSLIPINSNTFGWTDTSDYEKLSTLPDGLWKFNQSISPNDCLNKDYFHFRIVNLKKKIMCYVSEQLDLSNPNCHLNDDWYQDVFNLLQLLEMAKYLAENCDKCNEAVIIYNQVKNQTRKFTCSDC